MATQYFFSRGNEQFGPYTGTQLQALANAGKIQPTDAVWRAGVGRPIPAWRVKNLLPGVQAPPEAEGSEPATTEPSAAAPEAVNSPETPVNEDAEKAAAAFTPEEEKPVAKPPVKERPRRVLSIKGGVIVSQDGKYVQFRKKCEKCGYMEQGKNNSLIRPGAMKIPFFCRKCRKGRMVEMMAVG